MFKSFVYGVGKVVVDVTSIAIGVTCGVIIAKEIYKAKDKLKDNDE